MAVMEQEPETLDYYSALKLVDSGQYSSVEAAQKSHRREHLLQKTQPDALAKISEREQQLESERSKLEAERASLSSAISQWDQLIAQLCRLSDIIRMGEQQAAGVRSFI